VFSLLFEDVVYVWCVVEVMGDGIGVVMFDGKMEDDVFLK